MPDEPPDLRAPPHVGTMGEAGDWRPPREVPWTPDQKVQRIVVIAVFGIIGAIFVAFVALDILGRDAPLLSKLLPVVTFAAGNIVHHYFPGITGPAPSATKRRGKQ